MPSRFPPRWLNFIGLPPSGLGKEPPGTEFYYLGMPARWLRPGEVIGTYDVWARKVKNPDREGTIDQYLNVMPNWVGTKIGEGSAAARVLRVLYLT